MRRLLSAVVAFVFVAGQMAVTTHAAESIHQRCAEHGEVIDASTASQVEEGARIVPAEPASHGDHCLLAAALGQQAGPESGESWSSIIPSTLTGAGCADGSLLRPVAVIRFAPKTSPPRS